jgi:hypothetical protein
MTNQVERALKLVSTGTLTIAVVQAAKGSRGISLPKMMNHSTGKTSTRQTGFNDVTWGTSTRAYAKAIRKLQDHKFEAIITSSLEFSKKSHHTSDERLNNAIVEDKLDLDERAQLVNISDSESEECEDGSSQAEAVLDSE